MRVRLRFFAALREQLGTSATRTIPAGTSVGTLWRALVRERPELGRMRVRFAVNHEYVDDSHALRDDDEIAFMPPVSGGSR